MKRHMFILIGCLLVSMVGAYSGNLTSIPTIYVDADGVMHWSDTHREASFFGVNYTLPFAHGYRAMGYLGVERKSAIDRDVYHLARLGINAYRIHIWDVEVSDKRGNLLENEHLDLLDYLICKLRERGIRTFITAQTNFGNGYPEHNKITDGYSYYYDKCTVHSNEEAIAAQERYLAALVCHVNPYTGYAYKDDPFIVGFEVNNEPCHAGTVQETEDYINRMLKALKRAGNRKPVFYNVSHNREVVEAYYATAIQGTTYQWYPTGLVSGHMRKGNFLPYVDCYNIPFEKLKNFDKKARMIYEFDPADVLCSYLYPATVRTLRSAGFQWITQFAYDPIDMAAYNTEYQTHYLNVAYTPNKAVGMMIAAEVARRVERGETFGCYPADTLFADFRVSASLDLSELNSGDKFYYSNNTCTSPKAPLQLRAIAGCGSSPVVSYQGTGVYWIDRLEPGVWRLEVMPDAVTVSDPFAKPSLDKEVVRIISNAWDMTLDLPDLGKAFSVKGLNAGNIRDSFVTDGTISALKPGVYLLQSVDNADKKLVWTPDAVWNNIKLGEYVQPEVCNLNGTKSQDKHDVSRFTVVHSPVSSVDADKDLLLEFVVAGEEKPDSVILYTDKISFWNAYNPHIKMEHAGGCRYRAVIPASELMEGSFRYNVVVCCGGRYQTFPAGVAKHPLDWDYTSDAWWKAEVVQADSPLLLMDAVKQAEGTEIYMFPEWGQGSQKIVKKEGTDWPVLQIVFKSEKQNPVFFVRRYIQELIAGRKGRATECRSLCLQFRKLPHKVKAGFITSDGYTYLASCAGADASGIVRIPLSELRQTDTALLPGAFPVFLDNYFHPQTELPFHAENIDMLELRMEGTAGEEMEMELFKIWLE